MVYGCTSAMLIATITEQDHKQRHEQKQKKPTRNIANMHDIDPNDFVQVEGDQTSLTFQDPKQQGRFELGVCMAIYKWEELRTAVENSWGGPNSADKRDWLSATVIDLFQEKAVDLVLIEETLLYAMVDEFDTEIDNDSALEIADLVLKLYKDCSVQNYTRVDELYARYLERKSRGENHAKVKVESDPNNPDSSDEQTEEEEELQLVDDDMTVDESEPEKPLVDDDGFELVVRKGRRC